MLILRGVLTDERVPAGAARIHGTAYIHAIEIITVSRRVIRSVTRRQNQARLGGQTGSGAATPLQWTAGGDAKGAEESGITQIKIAQRNEYK